MVKIEIEEVFWVTIHSCVHQSLVTAHTTLTPLCTGAQTLIFERASHYHFLFMDIVYHFY